LKREKRVVHRTRRWLEKFNPINESMGQNNQPMVNWRIVRWKEKKR
jgi:hypothetical protein